MSYYHYPDEPHDEEHGYDVIAERQGEEAYYEECEERTKDKAYSLIANIGILDLDNPRDEGKPSEAERNFLIALQKGLKPVSDQISRGETLDYSNKKVYDVYREAFDSAVDAAILCNADSHEIENLLDTWDPYCENHDEVSTWIVDRRIENPSPEVKKYQEECSYDSKLRNDMYVTLVSIDGVRPDYADIMFEAKKQNSKSETEFIAALQEAAVPLCYLSRFLDDGMLPNAAVPDFDAAIRKAVDTCILKDTLTADIVDCVKKWDPRCEDSLSKAQALVDEQMYKHPTPEVAAHLGVDAEATENYSR